MCLTTILLAILWLEILLVKLSILQQFKGQKAADKIIDPAGNVCVENPVGQMVDHVRNYKGWIY